MSNTIRAKFTLIRDNKEHEILAIFEDGELIFRVSNGLYSKDLNKVISYHKMDRVEVENMKLVFFNTLMQKFENYLGNTLDKF